MVLIAYTWPESFPVNFALCCQHSATSTIARTEGSEDESHELVLSASQHQANRQTSRNVRSQVFTFTPNWLASDRGDSRLVEQQLCLLDLVDECGWTKLAWPWRDAHNDEE
jgi:hypothetical protein